METSQKVALGLVGVGAVVLAYYFLSQPSVPPVGGGGVALSDITVY